VADDAELKVPTGNGESLSLKLGNRAVSVTSRDLISVLLILLAGLGGYFIATQVTSNQSQGLVALGKIAESIHTNQVMWVERLAANQEKIVGEIHANRQSMSEEVRAQNILLHQQTSEFKQAFDAQTDDINKRFDMVFSKLVILNHNMRNPDRALPLDIPASQLPQPERPR
jgi:hypothetical protein